MLVYYFIHYKVYSKFVHSVLRCILKNKHFPAAYEYAYCEALAWAHILTSLRHQPIMFFVLFLYL